MVLVDTSVWIALCRRESDTVGQKILALVSANGAALCGQVWVEYLGGFRKREERLFHEKALKNFPFIEQTRSVFEKAAELWSFHPRLGPGDAIIAATCIIAKTPLFTLDKDFFTLEGDGLLLF